MTVRLEEGKMIMGGTDDRLKKIIEVIRSRPEWKPTHEVMKFANGEVGYYDTQEKGEFFDIKFNGIVVNHKHDGAIDIEGPLLDVVHLDIDEWLKEIEKIISNNIIMTERKRFTLTEVK